MNEKIVVKGTKRSVVALVLASTALGAAVLLGLWQLIEKVIMKKKRR